MKQPILSLLAVALTCQGVLAGISSARPLVSLAQDADLIVVGTAKGTFVVGEDPSFAITVSRVLKGNISVAAILPVSLIKSQLLEATVLPRGRTIEVRAQGIWFLRLAPSGWALIPAVQGTATIDSLYITTVAGTPISSDYAYTSAASVQEKIASEIAAAIQGTEGPYSQPVYSLLSGNLDTLSAGIAERLYTSLAETATGETKCFGLAGLIRLGNAKTVTKAAQLAEKLSPYQVAYGVLLAAIRDNVRSIEPATIASMGEIVTNSGLRSDFREGVAHALARIHTKDSLPFLAALLDESDVRLRVEGVSGLAAFANGLASQLNGANPTMSDLQLPPSAPYQTEATIANFAMGETVATSPTYVTFWKAWWTENRSKVGY